MAAVAPASAATDDGADPERSLERTEEELADARDGLAELEATILEVEQEVAAADAALAGLREQLAAVEGELADADELAVAAEAEVAAARDRQRAADAELADAEEAWTGARDALEERVALTWMHGASDAEDVLLHGLLSSRDMHAVAVVRRAAEGLLDADQRLVTAAVETSQVAADALVVAEERSEEVEARANAAYAARGVAQELVERQRRLVADADAQRDARAAALARIEQDAEARAALVQQLTARVVELRAASLDAWLREIAQLPFDGPAPTWAGRLPAGGRPLGPALEAAAAAAGIDGRLLAALVWTESSFRPGAVSPAGAIGLAQLMPSTARGLGVDPHDPLQNLAGGARYLRLQLDRFGRIDLALAAYNAGPGRVERAGNQIPEIVETQLYVLRVLDRWATLAG